MKAPDFTDYRFTGKEGKAYVVTNGISTRYLTGKEFRQFSRQLFNL
tara:strand:+ start:152 stop:289 length:138 start_codon:yes stop_codon:yes gene_type:complete